MDHYIIASFEVTTIGCRNAPKSLTNPNHKQKKIGGENTYDNQFELA